MRQHTSQFCGLETLDGGLELSFELPIHILSLDYY